MAEASHIDDHLPAGTLPSVSGALAELHLTVFIHFDNIVNLISHEFSDTANILPDIVFMALKKAVLSDSALILKHILVGQVDLEHLSDLSLTLVPTFIG